MRGCVYEAGTTLLRYEEELAVANQQPACLLLPCGPPGDSESSHASDASQETGDSGRYSQEEESSETDDSSGSPAHTHPCVEGERSQEGLCLEGEPSCTVPIESTEAGASCSSHVCQQRATGSSSLGPLPLSAPQQC